MNQKRWAQLVVIAGALLSAHAAQAVSGVVNGKLEYYENEGNYCPSSRNCTGAKYVESQYNSYMPVSDVKVYLRLRSNDQLLGQGTTDTNGNFSVSWYYPNSGAVIGYISWAAEHKGGRFTVRYDNGTATGSPVIFSAWDLTLTAGGTYNMSYARWMLGYPHPYANVYAGAWRMWTYSLGQSSRMNSYFTGLTILVESSATSADIYNNRVKISSASFYSPQGGVMHEMGHIASIKASRDQYYQGSQGNLGCYPDKGPPCPNGGWFLTSTEWASAGFEDAVATHFADVGLYHSYAVQPHSCISAAACGDGSFNLETIPSCGGEENRRPINYMRYFWDNYDTNSDFAGENLSRGVYEFADVMYAFDNGFGNRQKNEPFVPNTWNLDLNKYDGRGPFDFYANWYWTGTDSGTNLVNNCALVGD